VNPSGEIVAFVNEQARRRGLELRPALEPIPDVELPRVQAMTNAERRAWYRAKRAERKRERKARKRGRAGR